MSQEERTLAPTKIKELLRKIAITLGKIKGSICQQHLSKAKKRMLLTPNDKPNKYQAYHLPQRRDHNGENPRGDLDESRYNHFVAPTFKTCYRKITI